ncbi:hypothetical protein I5Q31_05595 [Serratia marcescens]|nr:hypothetical protein [Serratia marcescens]MBH2766642.1 hypothetical protein [Serratia marcescens]MBH2766702.1 hypothetical protein [Serratia marcescens]
MKKITIAKLAALMAAVSVGAAQAATITDVNPQSVDVTFTDSTEIYHTLQERGPFATGSADSLAHPIVAVGSVTSKTPTTHVAIQWGSSGDTSCVVSGGLPTTTCLVNNAEGINPMTFKLVQQGGADLPDAGATADGWYGQTTGQLNYNIKLDSGVKAEGAYRLTVSASAYQA